MRKRFVAALAIVAVVTFCAVSRAADEPAAEKKKSEDRRSELFDKLDANHDGQIAPDEVPEEQRRLFNRLLRQGDDNHDGKLGRAEFLSANADAPPANVDARSNENSPSDRRPEAGSGQRSFGGGMGALGGMGNGQFMMGVALLHALDTNGDGVLDASEIAAANAALKKLDTNSDGEVSREEMRAAVPPAMTENLRAGMPGAGGAQGGNPEAAMARLMTQFDANKDGKLEKSELPPRLQEQFDELDRNHDGSLDESETRAILPRLIRRMENGNAPGTAKGGPSRRPEAEKRSEAKKVDEK